MNLKIFAGSASQKLTTHIIQQLYKAGHLELIQGCVYLHTFPSGEPYCQFLENIRGCDVFLVQSVCNPAHERLVELLVMIDAAKRASAGRITVVAPYLGFLRQDRKTKSRTPITARLVADLLITAGAQRLVGMDFHCDQAQGFFNIPVDHLYAAPVFMDYLTHHTAENSVIVAPDAGGIKRAATYAEALGRDFAFISKRRISDSTVRSYGLVGSVLGRDVVIVDDLTESCGTIMEAARILKENGAQRITAIVTHALLNETAYERLDSQHMLLDKLIVTDTISQSVTHRHVEVLSIAKLFATAIYHINRNKSITELFSIKGF